MRNEREEVLKRLIVALFCLMLSACSLVHHKPAAPVSPVDHAHFELLNVHSTLLLVKPRYDAKTLTPAMMNQFNQTAAAFNLASRTWEDYQSALRLHGDSKWVLKQFNAQLVNASNLGGMLKLQYQSLPPDAPSDEKKP